MKTPLEQRMQDELSNPDPEALKRVMLEHGGLARLHYALHSFPSVRDHVEASLPGVAASAEPRAQPLRFCAER